MPQRAFCVQEPGPAPAAQAKATEQSTFLKNDDLPEPASNANTNGMLPVRPLRGEEGAVNFSVYQPPPQPPKPIPKFTTGAPYPKPGPP